MGRRTAGTPAARLRRLGVRVSDGPWTACGQKPTGRGGRLIVALGRAAGGATTRSRVRRTAREVFATQFGRPARLDVLLLARGDLSVQPRRQVRARLAELFTRVSNAVARQQASHA